MLKSDRFTQDKMVLRFQGEEYSPNPIPKNRVDYITKAVQDYVLRVLEKSPNSAEIEKFYKKWDIPLDPTIKRDIKLKITLLQKLEDSQFPTG